jgi:hypothetical protein
MRPSLFTNQRKEPEAASGAEAYVCDAIAALCESLHAYGDVEYATTDGSRVIEFQVLSYDSATAAQQALDAVRLYYADSYDYLDTDPLPYGDSELAELGMTPPDVLSVTRSLHTGASGRSILACLPEPIQRQVLAEPVPDEAGPGVYRDDDALLRTSPTSATGDTPSGSRNARRYETAARPHHVERLHRGFRPSAEAVHGDARSALIGHRGDQGDRSEAQQTLISSMAHGALTAKRSSPKTRPGQEQDTFAPKYAGWGGGLPCCVWLF